MPLIFYPSRVPVPLAIIQLLTDSEKVHLEFFFDHSGTLNGHLPYSLEVVGSRLISLSLTFDGTLSIHTP